MHDTKSKKRIHHIKILYFTWDEVHRADEKEHTVSKSRQIKINIKIFVNVFSYIMIEINEVQYQDEFNNFLTLLNSRRCLSGYEKMRSTPRWRDSLVQRTNYPRIPTSRWLSSRFEHVCEDCGWGNRRNGEALERQAALEPADHIVSTVKSRDLME